MGIKEITFTVIRESLPRSIPSLLVAGTPLLVALYFLLSFSLKTSGGALLGGAVWGDDMEIAMQPLDMAMQGILYATASMSLMILFLILLSLASATTGRFFTPGRIEFLLSLPVSRPTIIAGIFLGIMGTLTLWSLYLTFLLLLTFGILAGYWPWFTLAYVPIFLIQISPLVAAILVGAAAKPEKPSMAFAFCLFSCMIFSNTLALGLDGRFPNILALLSSVSLWKLLFASLFPHNIRMIQFALRLFEDTSFVNLYGFLLLSASHLLCCGAVFCAGLFLFKKMDY